MKSLALKLTLILSSIFFTACSNMQIGFEEDSPFYTSPSEKKSEITTEVLEVKKEAPVVKKEAPAEEENETAFSYSREDGE